MSVKYSKKLDAEISRVVRNFNSKISRLKKTERDLILPDKVSVSDIKANASTKWDLNRKLKELKRFSIRGIENTIITEGGVKTSKYALDNLQREQRRLYQALGKKIKEYGDITPEVFGIRQDATYKQMGNAHIQSLKSKRKAIRKNALKINKETFRDLESLVERIQYNVSIKDEVFKNNYMDSMIFILGYTAGYDREKMEYIREKLLTLSTKQFVKLFETDLGIQGIVDYYTALGSVLNKDVQNDVIGMLDQLYNNIDSLVKQYS